MSADSTTDDTASAEAGARIDRLLDAIDLIRDDQRDQAYTVLRGLIREDSDFEAAWLWMSVTVNSLDQSSVCLDNVLRINPNNLPAALALARMRTPDILFQRRRQRYRLLRDVCLGLMWLLILTVMYSLFFGMVSIMNVVSG